MKEYHFARDEDRFDETIRLDEINEKVKELIALRRKPKAWFVSLGRLIKKEPQVLTKIHSVAGFDKFLLDKMYPESMALKYIPVKTR